MMRSLCSSHEALTSLAPYERLLVTVSIVSPSIYHKVMELDAMIFIF